MNIKWNSLIYLNLIIGLSMMCYGFFIRDVMESPYYMVFGGVYTLMAHLQVIGHYLHQINERGKK